METILPAGVRQQAGTRPTTVYRAIENLTEKLAALETEKKAQKKQGPLLTPKQRRVLEVLQKSPEPMTLGELARAAHTSDVPIKALRKMGLFRSERIRRKSKIFEELENRSARTRPLNLNPEQTKAVAKILDYVNAETFKTILLHGVTGAADRGLSASDRRGGPAGMAIVLVPEISLTPQTVRRFRERFDGVAVLHSHLTDIERHVEETDQRRKRAGGRRARRPSSLPYGVSAWW